MSNNNEIQPRVVSSTNTSTVKSKVREDDGLMMIDSFTPGRAFIVSAMWGIIVAIVMFLACAALVFGMSKIGIMGSINALMGEAMQLTVPMLMKMSVLFSIIIGVAVCVFDWLRLVIYNSISFLTGGLVMRVHMVDRIKEGDSK